MRVRTQPAGTPVEARSARTGFVRTGSEHTRRPAADDGTHPAQGSASPPPPTRYCSSAYKTEPQPATTATPVRAFSLAHRSSILSSPCSEALALAADSGSRSSGWHWAVMGDFGFGTRSQDLKEVGGLEDLDRSIRPRLAIAGPRAGTVEAAVDCHCHDCSIRRRRQRAGQRYTSGVMVRGKRRKGGCAGHRCF